MYLLGSHTDQNNRDKTFWKRLTNRGLKIVGGEPGYERIYSGEGGEEQA